MKHNFNALISKDKISIKNILMAALFATIIFSTFTNGLFISQAMASSVTSDPDNNVSTTQFDTLSFIQFSNATSYTNQSATKDTTITTITPNPATFSVGTPVIFTATVRDTTDPSSSMIGIVKWTDNDAGGSFSPDACIISNNHCSLDYTPPSNPSGTITITASYAGDSVHSKSSATSSLSINTVSSQSTSQSNTPSPTITQSNVSPKTTQPSTQSQTTAQSNTQSNVPPTTTQSLTQSQTTAQSNTQSTTQSDSKTATHPSETSTGVNHQPQVSPLAAIGQAISKTVSELETLFQKL